MLDLVKCAHCNTPVSWPDYSEHVELWHGNWKGILPPTGLPEIGVLTVQQDQIDELEKDAQESADIHMDAIEEAKDRIRELEYDLDEAKIKIEELLDKIETLEGK